MKTLSRYFALPVVTAVMALVACDSVEQSGNAGSIERVRFAEYQNYKDFGDYVLHVNGLGTNELPPDVAISPAIAEVITEVTGSSVKHDVLERDGYHVEVFAWRDGRIDVIVTILPEIVPGRRGIMATVSEEPQ